MMASDTMAFMPWMSVTTVTIEVTATMLPSTVMNERSLFAQIAWSAMTTESKICCTRAFEAGVIGSAFASPARAGPPLRRPAREPMQRGR